MKILDIYINGFGKFHGRNLSFEDGLNIVYGKNEAGKSTIHTFIRGMLFGIEKQRGRASRNDLYSKFEPWENSGTYEGQLRLEHKDHIYRIERTFQKNKKEFKVVDETAGREIEPTKAFLDDLLSGLSETAYNNTVSIGQLKSATDEGMVSELKNYIANLNTTGNIALNITKATSFLKSQHKELESQMVPEAARTYTSLLSEIRNTEKEIASPEYENQIQAYQRMRVEVKDTLEVEDVKIACVSAGFPSSQTFIEVKVAETAMAIMEGADEIDIVISVGKFLSGDYETMCDEIQELKATCKEHHLKVILETGALKTAANIKKASILSMYAGADFIKTSTGKQQPAATPEAAYVMCQAIKEYYALTGNKIGFKPAGGINCVNDALIYYTIVKEVLGEEWLNNGLFRLGTSRLANLLLSEIKGEEMKFF